MSKSNESVERYRRARELAKQMNSKLIRYRCPAKDDITKSARKLTIPMESNTILFDDELDMAALTDFHFNEMRFGGKRLVDWADAESLGMTVEEARMLESLRNARAGLYEIGHADPENAIIRLTSVLPETGEAIQFSDIGLSESATQLGSILAYLRVMRFEDIAMSTGVFFSFPLEDRARLIEEHRRRMWTVKEPEKPLRRFVFFYRQFRQHGLQQALNDPV